MRVTNTAMFRTVDGQAASQFKILNFPLRQAVGPAERIDYPLKSLDSSLRESGNFWLIYGLQVMTRNPVSLSLTLSIVVLGFFSMLAGCQEKPTISGRVMLDGRPLSGAVIQFSRGSTEDAITSKIENGNFEISSNRLRPGQYHVTIVSQDAGAKEMIEGFNTGEGIPAPKAFVPKIYEKPGALKTTIKEGENSPLNFQLKSLGG